MKLIYSSLLFGVSMASNVVAIDDVNVKLRIADVSNHLKLLAALEKGPVASLASKAEGEKKESLNLRRLVLQPDIINVTESDGNATTDSAAQCEVELEVCTLQADSIKPKLIVGLLSKVDPTGGLLSRAVLDFLISFTRGEGIDLQSLLSIGVILLTETQILELIGNLIRGGNVGTAVNSIVHGLVNRSPAGENAIDFASVLERLNLAETGLVDLIATVVSSLTGVDVRAVLTVVRIVVNILTEIVGIELPSGGEDDDDTGEPTTDDDRNDKNDKNTDKKDQKGKKIARILKTVKGSRVLKGQGAQNRKPATVPRKLQIGKSKLDNILALLQNEGDDIAIPHRGHIHQVPVKDELDTLTRVEIARLFAFLRSILEPLRGNGMEDMFNSTNLEMENITIATDWNETAAIATEAPSITPTDDLTALIQNMSFFEDKKEEPKATEPPLPSILAILIEKLSGLLTVDLVINIVLAVTKLLLQTAVQLAASESPDILVDGPFSYLGGLIGLASRSLEKPSTADADNGFFVPGLVQLVSSLAIFQGTYAYLDDNYPQFANTTKPDMMASVDAIESQMHDILVDVSNVLELNSNPAISASASASAGLSSDGINCRLELLACETTTSMFTGTRL